MIDFQRITLRDLPRLRPYIRMSGSRACDNTVGGVFMWRDFFQTEYAFVGESLLLRVCYLGGVQAHTVPLGGDTSTAIDALSSHCVERGEQLVFCTVNERDLPLLRGRFDCFVSTERDWFDYLYLAEDIIKLAGRRYSGQRNHINAFKRQFSGYSFEEIGPENLEEVRRFYTRFKEIEKKDSDVFREDQLKVDEILSEYAAYGLLGGALRAGGEILAFAIGEIVGDTLFVHVEKADFTVRGTYQMIVNEFAKHYAAEGVTYVNREDDAGDAGLRASKMSYHPLRLIEKYTVLAM